MELLIIDRRLSGKNKSIGNRERFMRRYKEQLTDRVRRAVSERGIRDMERGQEVSIPRKDINEPMFHHGPGGVRDTVHPGNREYVTGDKIARPQGGSGQGSQASNQGEGEDDFTFTLTKEEFMQLFFADLALPRLVQTHLGRMQEWKNRRAGYSQDGTPNNLALVRTMRSALGRRIALGKDLQRQIAALQAQLDELLVHDDGTSETAAQLQQRICALRQRRERLAFLDPIDMRFRSYVKQPLPISRAVMFCVMDVSGSMDEQRKDLSKRFFILLYLFLTKHYEKIDIVFIRHHTQAAEVSEEEFFHAKESGGTIVSSALQLLVEIIQARYPVQEWNIYVAQASDGDNFPEDTDNCSALLAKNILPLVRYFAYVQVAQEEQNLWQEYARLQPQFPQFAMRKAMQADEIYPVFRDLFKKQGVQE